jgi:hypothetical protein
MTLLSADERDELRAHLQHMRLLAMHPEDEKLWADLCKAVEDSERCEALEDGIKEALTSPAVCVYDDLRHLLASGKGDSDGA